jgi:hypothetical protein
MTGWNRLQRALAPYFDALTLVQWSLVILGGAFAIWLIIRIRAYFREDADDADQTLEMLTQFRDLHQEGGLSDDEFRLIRSRLTLNVQESLVAGKAKPSAISAESGTTTWEVSERVISKESTALNTTDHQDIEPSGTREKETE